MRDGQLAVTVDDVVGTATRDGVVAGAAEEDVAVAEDRARGRAEARGEMATTGAELSVRGCGTIAFRPWMRSTPA